MNRKIFLTLFLCTFYLVSFAQFKQNAIGVCYLQRETADDYTLTICFPFEMLEKEIALREPGFKDVIDSLIYNGDIILFDSTGEIGRVAANKEKFLVEFWCDNDGGSQYRPTLRTTIRKNSLTKQLKGIKAIQNICCFAIINKDANKTEEPDFKISTDIRLTGDYNKDRKSDCFIWTFIDEAHNCDGEPKNYLEIRLQVGKEHFNLRCCGP